MNTAHIIDSNAWHIFDHCEVFGREDVKTYKDALDLVAKKKPVGVQLLPSGIFVVPSLFAMSVSIGIDDNFIFHYN